jgi:formyltetrahydrofolate synthetase
MAESTIRHVELKSPVPSDIDIAHAVNPIDIRKIASFAGVHEDELEMYGPSKAKVSLKILERLQQAENGNYVVVTGMNPTSFGEGT